MCERVRGLCLRVWRSEEVDPSADTGMKFSCRKRK